MWTHATRTKHIESLLSAKRIGEVVRCHSTFSAFFPKEMVAGGIRGNPLLEPTGALGDMCWYTVGVILFSHLYVLPERVFGTAELLENGAIYHVSGQLVYGNGCVSTFDAGKCECVGDEDEGEVKSG
jgi:predicted dehydrogenase